MALTRLFREQEGKSSLGKGAQAGEKAKEGWNPEIVPPHQINGPLQSRLIQLSHCTSNNVVQQFKLNVVCKL